MKNNTDVNLKKVKGKNCLEECAIAKCCSGKDNVKLLGDWIDEQNSSYKEVLELIERFQNKQIFIFADSGDWSNVPTLIIQVEGGATFECAQIFTIPLLKKLLGKMNWQVKKVKNNRHLLSAPIH